MHTSKINSNINPINPPTDAASAVWSEATSALREAGSLAAVEPLPGAVVVQYIRCGKPHCRCQDEEKHGPYYYRVWREGLKVQKVYVCREDLKKVRAQCTRHQEVQEILRRAAAYRLALVRQIARCRRDYNRLSRRG